VWNGGEAEAEMRLAVAASVVERRGEPADNGLLRRIAQSSGGAFFSRWPSQGLIDRIPAAERSNDPRHGDRRMESSADPDRLAWRAGPRVVFRSVPGCRDSAELFHDPCLRLKPRMG